VLLYLHRNTGDEYAALALSERLHISPDLVLETITGLVADGLAAPGKAEGTFRFQPGTAAKAEAVEALAATYQERSAAVLSTMSVYAIERIRSGPLRAFAESFVLGKGKRDG
jgi:hypothetical protein